jgi:16S rRNA (cytosine967-C5)-methyltransferase
MTPSARLAAAIELLDEIVVAARTKGAAADTLARRYFGTRRYIGSKDRRAIRELTWRAIRACADIPPRGRAVFAALADDDAELAALFDGSAYGPPSLGKKEQRAVLSSGPPKALAGLLYPLLDDAEIAALSGRAPVDIRMNVLRVADLVVPEGGEQLPAPLAGWRYPADTTLDQHPAYLAGAFEVQDAGSQWIAQACAVRPGMRVIDFCAGAGGKSLALASAMAGRGSVLACDTDRRRLGQLAPRAERAGATIIQSFLLNPGQETEMLAERQGSADVVLVDAPCSGSGTWRRNPEARWRVEALIVARLAREQARLLDMAADLVAPGGALVYAVCALTEKEGTAVVGEFLAKHAGWSAIDLHSSGVLPDTVGRRVGDGVILSPHHDATDGFFFARLQAP